MRTRYAEARVCPSTIGSERLINRFRISAKMRPYVLRLRLSAGAHFDFGSDPSTAVEFTRCVEQMRAILIRRKVPVVDADRAILEILPIAFDHRLSRLRFKQRQIMKDHSQQAINQLTSSIGELRRQISPLPPSSLAVLNRHLTAVLEQSMIFDTEILIDVLDATAKALCQVSPRRRAEDAYSVICRQPSLVNLWESIPAVTRVKVEALMQNRRPLTSLVAWLDTLRQLLDQERPVRKEGAPPSVLRVFAKGAARVWERLDLIAGRRYDANKGHIKSDYQRFCDLALAAFGDTSKLSGRQVSNAKKSLSASPNPK